MADWEQSPQSFREDQRQSKGPLPGKRLSWSLEGRSCVLAKMGVGVGWVGWRLAAGALGVQRCWAFPTQAPQSSVDRPGDACRGSWC